MGGFASESINYVDVGLTLNVEPTIYLNNEVAIRISLEVSNLVDTITTKSGTVGYRIGTRSATTMLQLKDGENQVLAGLIRNEEGSSGSKVPGIDQPTLQYFCDIDLERCIGCDLCERWCPWDAIDMVPTPEIAEAVANKGGPPEYVEKNWERLVKAAHDLAVLAVEQQAAKK